MKYLLFIFSLLIFTNLQAKKNNNPKFLIVDSVPGNLPLTIVPAVKTDLPLIFFISGDGGWNSFSSSLAQQLSQKGFTVIGLDSKKYFWNERTPEETTADVSKAVEYYLKQYNKSNFVLMGYSFGAGVVPFVASGFNNNLKLKLKAVVSLSADLSADFEIHVSDMLGFKKNKEKYDVLAEERKIEAYNPICFFGDKEDKDITNAFKHAGFKTVILPGNHHYADNYFLIAAKITEELK